MNLFKDHSKTNALMAALVAVISAIVYLLTMAPSICLWDCGEYLAASAGLGIPHPPGTPLLVMFSRAWILSTSFLHDIGYRFNLIAVFGSVVTVVFVYLIVVRGLIFVIGEPDTVWKRLTVYCAGFMGALFCAFGKTFWFAALETSQQSNITNVTVVITVWLALVWAQSKSPHRDRLLLLISYIAFAGVGIRMISMLMMPVIFLFVIIVDPQKRKDWRLWGATFALALVLYNLSWFLIVVPAVTLISLVMMYVSQRERARWRFSFWFLLLPLIGFSCHIYLPIRASLNPMIDEGHPVIKAKGEFPYFDITALKDVLDRKQYGNESMVSRSLFRRGALERQFGIEGHMGYGGFHLLQFFHFDTRDQEKNFVDSAQGYGKLLIYLLPTLFVLLGFYLMGKKNIRGAILLISVTLITTLAMIWYMNFSDGTRSDNRQEYAHWERNGKQGPMPTIYREVRVRDYFYSSGFVFFSMWMGLSAGMVLLGLFTDKRKQVRGLAAPIALVLFAVSPALPLTQNYSLRDRSQNWMPFEYAYNLLMSCDKDGILFTNGDNDTFPLWAIQEAYGIRRDVRIVNLSLVNTDWYIRQLKKLEPRVPISYSEAEIARMQPEYNPFETATPVQLSNTKLKIVLPGRDRLQALKVQDKMVLNIVDANNFKKPVYFASSVSPDNFMGLDPYMQMQGMVYRLMPEPVSEKDRIDVERIANLFDKVYKLRPYPQGTTDKDEPYEGIINDYAMNFMWLSLGVQDRMEALSNEIKALEGKIADPQVKTGQTSTALADSAAVAAKKAELDAHLQRATKYLDKCVSLMPWHMQPVRFRHQILITHGKAAMAEERIRTLLAADPNNTQLRDMLVQSLETQGKKKEAQELLQGMPLPAGKG